MAYGHGKIILFGEHSVVHGHPALALAVPRGAEVTYVPARQGPTRLHIEPWNVEVDTGPEPNVGREALQEALRVARAFYEDEVEVSLSATMHLPSSAGMGSSAALGVAVLRAMDEARGVQRSDEEIFARSLAWERVFHGNPGGVDNAMATYGGVALYTKGAPLLPVVPRKRIRLVAGYSGSSSSTKAMVDSVSRQVERSPQVVHKLFEAIAAIVRNGKLAIEQGDLKALGQLMTMNHGLLSALMLSNEQLEAMIRAAKDAGALGAKVTGAGGGGCMIALVDSNETQERVKQALTDLGKTVYDVESGPDEAHDLLPSASRNKRRPGARAMSSHSVTALARANIALAKYWGKSDVALNLPAVPSISITLEPMRTETTVTFDASLRDDEVLLNGEPAKDKAKSRAVKVLDQVRALSRRSEKARVESHNNFPTASGLASSASGFAALVAAAWSAAGLARDDARWSAMARQASASAARSIYGGFVELPKGRPGDASLAATPIAPPDHWDVRIVVAVANEGPKDVGSTEGMTLSERTSPYYRAWVDCSDALADEVRAGILARNLTQVGEAMEQSTLAMHACMMASRPGLIYFQPATLAALATVKRLRKQGIEVYATMDAGPHVKALCNAADADKVAAALAETPMVLRTLTARPGPDLEVRT